MVNQGNIDVLVENIIKAFWEDEPTSKPLTTLLILAAMSDDIRIGFDIIEPRIDSLAFYIAYFNNLIRSWCKWEEECRIGGDKHKCENNFGVGGAAFHYSSSIKSLLLQAVEDHGLDWLIPYWLRWYIIRTRSTKSIAKLSELPLTEQVMRLADYPIMVIGLESLASAYLNHYSTISGESRNFAYSVAAYIYWDIVKPFTEVLWQRMSLVKQLYTSPLTKFSKEVSNAVRRFLVKGERLRLRDHLKEAMKLISIRIAYLLAELKSIASDNPELQEKLRLKLISGL